MITLILLHPLQPTPAQIWTFEDEPIISIGRSTDNLVVLYSVVVSRRHIELQKSDDGWQIVNVGANGTYLDGTRISSHPVVDGVIVRLARSGPQLQIRLGIVTPDIIPEPPSLLPQEVVNPLPLITEEPEDTTSPDLRIIRTPNLEH